jgi:ankyrin repeat protein
MSYAPPCRFLWVSRQLEFLRGCRRPQLRRALEELPGRLDETYERVLKGIDDANREPARRLLQCLTMAARPFRVEELAELFAIDFNAGGTNTGLRWDDQKDAVLSACAGLVSVIPDGADQVVQFWHFSVKEYLTSDRLARIKELSQFHIPLESSHATLAHACLNVLLRIDDHTEKDADPLLPYAAECWVKHAQFKDVELRPEVQDAMDAFFDTANPHFSAWVRIQRLHDLLDVPADSDIPVVPSAAPLYLATYYGFRGLVERMIAKHPEHVSACSGEYGTPLHASIQGGHIRVAELLLAHGADVNAPGTYSVTPLHVASRHGHLDAVKWLLDHGADVNAKRVDGQTALHSAAANGHLDVSRMLLVHNADVGARDVEGGTPLSFALEGAGGRLDLVRLLLDGNAEVNTRDNSGRTPLHYAAAFGYLEVAQLLLERKAKCNAQDDEGLTPLHRASDAPELGLMKVLLDHGADANARDNIGNTPLHQAAINTLVDVARVLLEYNAEANARNNCGATPSHLASEEGELDFVSLLLDYGADVQVRDNFGNTPLQIASANGHRGIVQILLDHEVEDDAQSDYTSTPSHFTSEEGDYDAVCASLDRFAEAQVRNNGGKVSSEVVGDCEQQRIAQLLSPGMSG